MNADKWDKWEKYGKNKLPPKVEDFLRELFGDEAKIDILEARSLDLNNNRKWQDIEITCEGESICFPKQKLQKRYEGLVK